MNTYTAHAIWDDTGWWVVTVPVLGPGAVTQSRRLDQVADDVAEVIALLAGERPDSYHLEVEWDDPSPTAADARRLREEAHRITTDAQEATRAAVVELRDVGLSYRDIASMTGISYQRAQQLTVRKSKETRPRTVRQSRSRQSKV